MKKADRKKLTALDILKRLSKNSKFNEDEIEEISVKLGRKIMGRN